MNKLYRGIIRIFQMINYSIYKRKFANRNNILSKLNLERLPDEIAREMSRGIRVNKQFPAGKTFFVNLEDYLIIWIIKEPLELIFIF